MLRRAETWALCDARGVTRSTGAGSDDQARPDPDDAIGDDAIGDDAIAEGSAAAETVADETVVDVTVVDETVVDERAADETVAHGSDGTTAPDVGRTGLTETRAGRRRRLRERRRRRGLIAGVIAAVAVAAIAATAVWAVTRGTAQEPIVAPTDAATGTTATTVPTGSPPPPPPETTAPAGTPGNLALAGDIVHPDSVTVLVNKITPLSPIDYVPADLVAVAELGIPSANGHSLRSAAANSTQQLFAAASNAGYTLDMTSGYRSYTSQTSLYEGYVSSLGQEAADATSAKPGYSEHQTGLTADISSPDAPCPLEQCFADTAEGQWLAANAWRYGFILRYPNGATAITGYEFEPWHFRYVGVEVSTAMHDQGIATYEEFLGAPAAPDYLG